MTKTTYRIGYYEETIDGPSWVSLKQIRRSVDAQAEAEVDGLKKGTPADHAGLHIRRGNAEWFRPFSCHA